MPRTIRFHLDEHIDPAVADGLTRRQIDVTTSADAGLLGADDDEHLSFANAQARVVVTNDSDFLRAQQRGDAHCGIVYCRPQTRTIAELNRPNKPWIDPRGPDGVTILAPYEQYAPNAHPGLVTGEPPRPMQLFDLQNDPGEQTDVAAQHPDVVARLKALFDEMNKSVP